jgi:hypothetical protein
MEALAGSKHPKSVIITLSRKREDEMRAFFDDSLSFLKDRTMP